MLVADKKLLFLFMESPVFQEYAEQAYVDKGEEIIPRDHFYLVDEGIVMWTPVKDSAFPYLPLVAGTFFGLPSNEEKRYVAGKECVLWKVHLDYLAILVRGDKSDFSSYVEMDTHCYERWKACQSGENMLEQELCGYLIRYFSNHSRVAHRFKPKSFELFSKRRGNKALNYSTALHFFEGINAIEEREGHTRLHLETICFWLEMQMQNRTIYRKKNKLV